MSTSPAQAAHFPGKVMAHLRMRLQRNHLEYDLRDQGFKK